MVKNKRKLFPSRRGSRLALTILAVVLIGFGGWGFWQKYRATNNPKVVIPTEVVRHSTDRPDETKPRCDESYKVASEQPRKIELPSLGVVGCIQPVGIDQNNQIAVPTNIHVAGWFVESVLPGKKGVSIIAGHAGGRYQDGIFKRIGELKHGDKVFLEYGDHHKKTFEVVGNNSYSVQRAAKEQFLKYQDIEEQLTLITCGGKFDQTSNQYDQRVVIRSKLLVQQ